MNRFEQRNSYGGTHGLMDSIDTNTGETAAYETPEQSEDSANTGAANGMGNMDNVGNMNGMNAGISDMYSQPQQGNYQQGNYQQGGMGAPQSGYYNANANAGTADIPKYDSFRPARNVASSERYILGIIGALIGSALGMVVWCIFGALGYISWLGGLALAAGAFFGYMIGARTIGKLGMLLIVIILAGSVYVGNRLSYSIDLYREFQDFKEEDAGFYDYFDMDPNASIPEIFMNFDQYYEGLGEVYDYIKLYSPVEVKDLTDPRAAYYGDLVKSYVMTGVASLVFFLDRRRKGMI
ncbi:uncharacterized protein BN718_01716 [Ruminococcus sp. CAG:579]|nr:uncharacterized protein BN718_01716 [Ruminococcus sp. CAG:579]